MTIRLAFLAALAGAQAASVQEDDLRRRAEALLQKLDSDAPVERDVAAEALIAGGDDFEKYIEKAAEEGKPEVRARCQDILKQIELGRKRRDHWSPVKPLALNLKDASLKDAVDRLAKVFGMEVKTGTANPKSRVNVALESVSPLAALDACCRSAGVWYKRNGTALELTKEKPPPAPSRVFLGPFALAAVLPKPRAGDSLSLQLDLEWEPGVKPRWFEIVIESGTDDKGGAVALAPPKAGRESFEPSLSTRHLNMPKEDEAKTIAFDELELTPLSKGAARIKSLKGKIRFFFPEEVQKVRFENPAKGDKKDLGVISATLDDFGFAQFPKGWGASIELNTFRTAREKRSALFAILTASRMRFYDNAGKAYATTYSGSGSGGHVTDPLQRMSVHTYSEAFNEKNPPKVIEMNVVTDIWEKAYSFEFRDLQPAK